MKLADQINEQIIEHLYDRYDRLTSWEQRFLDRLDNQLTRNIPVTVAQAVTIDNLLNRFPMETPMQHQINLQLSSIFPRLELPDNYFCFGFSHFPADPSVGIMDESVSLENIWFVDLDPNDSETAQLIEQSCCGTGLEDHFTDLSGFIQIFTDKARAEIEHHILEHIRSLREEAETERRIANAEWEQRS